MKNTDVQNTTLAIHLVTWNGEQYIPFLIQSLKQQTFQDFSLHIRDNASTDNTVHILKEQLKQSSLSYTISQNETNTGFAIAHNQLYAQSTSPYFLMLNQDMYLEKDTLAQLMLILQTHPDVASISPRLMRWDFERVDTTASQGFTNTIDSIGLQVLRNRRVVEGFQQQEWPQIQSTFPSSQYPVFGVSGALPLYQRSSIKDVEYAAGKFLDETYHSYKEDVDLAFRLAASGHKSMVDLDAVAYHDRTASGSASLSDHAAAANKTKQTYTLRYKSYRNHLMTLLKNENTRDGILDFPFILWYEIKKLTYFLLFDRQVLKAWKDIWNQREDIQKKRTRIQAKHRLHKGAMRKWWT